MKKHAQFQPNLSQRVRQVRLFCLTEPEFIFYRFSWVRLEAFLSVILQPNLTEPDRTCEKSQKTDVTEPLTPLFRGGQVRFGSVRIQVQL
jgi:hypothetical protein